VEADDLSRLVGVISRERMFLLLRNLFWTILIPGAVTVYLPLLILGRFRVPELWGPLQWLALPVGVTGVIILVYCIATFGISGRGTLSPLDAPRRLVVRGLYRYVRNPMYCGVLLILLAEVCFFTSIDLPEYAAGWLIFIHLVVVFYDEPALRRRFGDSYDDYSRVVRRWVPGKPYRFYERLNEKE
jgi:protein-S-isoprenylcysteine O-methyltransferase Ste14